MYDSAGTVDATMSAGTTVGAAYTDTPAAVTNEAFANDQTINDIITDFGDDDAIRFDFGASISARYIAVYFSAEETDNLDIYAGDHATTMDDDQGKLISHTDTFAAGWTIIDITASKAGRYWFVVADGAISNLTEVIIGTKLDFAWNPDLGGTTGDVYGVDLVTSYGGYEYTNKRHDVKKTWSWGWSDLSEAFKDNLATMRQAIDGNRLKFIYNDESSSYWVRMSANSLNMKEDTYLAFSTSVQLTEQLK